MTLLTALDEMRSYEANPDVNQIFFFKNVKKQNGSSYYKKTKYMNAEDIISKRKNCLIKVWFTNLEGDIYIYSN